MIYHFAGFALDDRLYQLRGPSGLLSIERKTFDLLAFLLEHHERVVSKRELLDALWASEAVVDAVVASTVLRARRVLGQESPSTGPIQTVHGRGYRLIAAVSVSREAARSGTRLRASGPDRAALSLAAVADGRPPSELPPGVRATVEVASVLGETFLAATVGRLRDIPMDALHRELDGAARFGLVKPVPYRAGRYAFASSALRERVYSEMPHSERASVHAEYAEHLALSAVSASEVVAFHAYAGLPFGCASSAVRLACQVAEQAITAGRGDDSALWYARALDAATHYQRATPELRLELALRLQRALRSGREGGAGNTTPAALLGTLSAVLDRALLDTLLEARPPSVGPAPVPSCLPPPRRAG